MADWLNVGDHNPDTSLSDTLTTVNRAVPGLDPSHVLTAAQTTDPVDAAHAIGGMNILLNHVKALGHMGAMQGAQGVQGVAGAAGAGTGEVTSQGTPFIQPTDYKNPLGSFGDWSGQVAKAGWEKAFPTVMEKGAGLIGGALNVVGSQISPYATLGEHGQNVSNEFHQGQQFGTGAEQAVAGSIGGAVNWVGSTSADLANLPEKFYNNPQAVLDQFRHDVANDFNVITNFPQRLYRYYTQTVHDKGAAYAEGQLFGILATALATGGVGEAGDAGALAKGVASAEGEGTVASKLAGLTGTTEKAYNFYRNVADSPITKVLTAPTKLVTVPARVATDLGTSTAGAAAEGMLLAQQGADGSDAARWAATADSKTWVNPYGKQFATFGQMLMHVMGIDPNTWYGHIGSGLTDFYTSFIMPDPLGAAGKVFSDARSLEGSSGLLHGLFGGTAIRSADDVDRIYRQYGAFRRTVQLIAETPVGKLTELYKGKLTPDLLLDLGKAKTPDEVLDVLKKHAASAELTSSNMITLGGYTRTKNALHEFARAEAGLPPTEIKTHRDLVDWVVSPTAGEFKRVANYFSKTLAQRGFWIDSETGVMMTDKILRADPAAIHVIQSRLRQAGMDESVIEQVGKDLLDAVKNEDHSAFIDTVRNSQKVAWKGFLHANLNDPQLADWVKAIADRSDKMMDDMLGFTGVGTEGLYTADRKDSLLVDGKGDPVASAAASTAHRAGVPLLAARDMRRAIKVLANIGKNDELQMLARPLAIAGKTDEYALRALREALDGRDASMVLRDIRNVFKHAEINASGAPISDAEAATKLFHSSRLGKYESVWLNIARGAGDNAEKVNQYRQWLLDQAKNSDEVGQLEAHYLSALIDTGILGRSMNPLKAFTEGARGVGAEAEAEYVNKYEELVGPYRNRGYRTSLAMRGDQIDHVINDLFFKPLTLSSPSWAWHVAASEAILNTFRYGPLNMMEARFAATIANKAAKYSLAPGVDYSYVRDAVASILEGITKEDLKTLREGGLSPLERERMIENGASEADVRAAAKELQRKVGVAREDLTKPQRYLTTPIKEGTAPVRGAIAGLGIGVRESLLKGLAGDAQAERLIGDAIDLKLLHPGGINPALSASHTAYIEGTAGEDDFGNDRVAGTRTNHWGKKFIVYDNRNRGHLNALQHFIGVTLASPEHQFVAKAFRDAINEMGSAKFIEELQATRKGSDVLYRDAEVVKQIEAKTVDYLKNLPAGERESMLRTKFFSSNAQHFSDITTPDEDFARVLVRENLNAWMSQDRKVMHAPLLDQIADHNVHSLPWFKKYAAKQGEDKMPTNIIGPEILGGSARRLPVFQTAVKLSNLSHDKMLGPMVDYISRQPTYLLAYHREMENIRNVNGVFTTTVGDALNALKAERDAAHSRIDALSSDFGEKAARLTDLSNVAIEKYQTTKQAQRDLTEAQNRLSNLVATHEASKEAVAAAANEFNAQTRRLTQARADEEKAARAYEAAVRQTGEIRRLERKVAAVHARFYRMDLPELSDKGQPILSPEEYFAKGPSESLFQREAAARAELMTAQDDYRAKVEQARRARESASAATREQTKTLDAAQSVVKNKRVARDQAFADVREGSKTANAAQRTADKAKKEIDAFHAEVNAAEQEMLDAIARAPENQEQIANEVGRIAELNEKITNHVVQPGMIHEAQAQVMAEQRAARKMIGEVHNPADRTNFEAAMSRFAPFYFAQNQAWRRAFRMMAEDPGAFEKYLKLTMAVTNFAHTHMVNGIPMVELPMNMFGINFGLDLSSLKSITPFGTSGDTSWAGLFRDTTLPAPGPIGMLTMQAAREGLDLIANATEGKKGSLAVDNAFTYAEGTSANMPMSAQIVPNTLARDIIEGYLGHKDLNASSDPLGNSYISTRLQVWKNVTQDTLDNIGKELMQKGFGNYNAATMRYVYEKNPAMFATYESMAFSIKAQNPDFLQSLATKANDETAKLWTVKTLAGFLGPTSVSLENRAGNALSTELENDIAKLGVTDGYAKFQKAHPLDQMTEVFTTAHPYGVSYPSTQSAMQFIDSTPHWVQNHEQIAAFFIPRPTNSVYSQAAHGLELQMGLSQRQNLSGLAKQAQIVWGNNWYYGSLLPQVQAQVDAGNLSQYNAGQILKKERASFATANPTWSSYYNNDRSAIAVASYNQLKDFYATQNTVDFQGYQLPAVVNSWPEESRLMALHIKQFMNDYNSYTASAANLSGSQKYQLEQNWYNFCIQIGGGYYNGKVITGTNPELASIIHTVFTRLPSSGVLNG